MEIKIQNISNLSEKVLEFSYLLKKHKLFLFNGQMGVGKTTFIIEVLNQIGIKNIEGSPTYSIINTYHSEELGKIYHIDLYRLKSLEELLDVGIEDLLNENAFLFIEWPDLLKQIVPNKYCELNFYLNPKNERFITVFENE